MCAGNPFKRPECQELLKIIEDWRVKEEDFDEFHDQMDCLIHPKFDLLPKIFFKLIENSIEKL